MLWMRVTRCRQQRIGPVSGRIVRKAMDTTSKRNGIVALAIVIVFILYGSTYPFNFTVPARAAGPLEILLRSWNAEPERGDLIANILFYVPLGLFAVRVFRPDFRPFWAFALTVLAGAILSVGCEILQYYLPGRVQSAGDVYANTFGTALGGLIALLFGTGRFLFWPLEFRDEPFPFLLLTSWLGYHLYPYVPVIDLSKYWDALKPLLLAPQFTAYDFFRYTTMWLTVAALSETITGRNKSRRLYPFLAAFVLAAKIVISARIVALDEVLGIGAGYLIWVSILGQKPSRRALLIVLPLYIYVILWRLQPFQFQAPTRPFGLTVFSSFARGAVEVNVQSFLEKVFYYGSLLWLTTEAGVRLRMSAIVVVALLLVTSVLEIYLPGRSAEISDAVMAVIMACLIKLLSPALSGPKSSRHEVTVLQPGGDQRTVRPEVLRSHSLRD